jgi:hypothetical protein
MRQVTLVTGRSAATKRSLDPPQTGAVGGCGDASPGLETPTRGRMGRSNLVGVESFSGCF